MWEVFLGSVCLNGKYKTFTFLFFLLFSLVSCPFHTDLSNQSLFPNLENKTQVKFQEPWDVQNPLVSVCLNGKYPTFTVFAFVLLVRLPSFLFYFIIFLNFYRFVNKRLFTIQRKKHVKFQKRAVRCGNFLWVLFVLTENIKVVRFLLLFLLSCLFLIDFSNKRLLLCFIFPDFFFFGGSAWFMQVHSFSVFDTCLCFLPWIWWANPLVFML